MAVYTKLTGKEMSEITDIYGIGELTNYSGIAKGIMNTNYLLETTKDKYILRILEGDRELEDEIRELEYLEYLASKGIPCPNVLSTLNGENYIIRDGKVFSLFSFLEGSEVLDISEEVLYKFGKILAQMHIYSENMELQRKEKIEMEYLYSSISKDEEKLKDILGEYYDKIIDKYKKVSKYDFGVLPKGIVHNDIFPDNVFVKDGEVTGVIDFNDALTAPFVYDIAIVMNFWIYNKYGEYKKNLINSFLRGYEGIREIKEEEKKAMPITLDKMALTFVFLRLKKFEFCEADIDTREIKDYRDLLNMTFADKEDIV